MTFEQEEQVARMGELFDRMAKTVSGTLARSVEKLHKDLAASAKESEGLGKAADRGTSSMRKQVDVAQKLLGVEVSLSKVAKERMAQLEVIGKLSKENAKRAADLKAASGAFASGLLTSQLVEKAKLDQAESVLDKKMNNAGLAGALKDKGYRKSLGQGFLEDQRGDNLGKQKQLAGLASAMNSGKLEPMLRQAAQLDKIATALEKKLAFEKLKAEKGPLVAYFTLGMEKAQAFSATIDKAFDGITRGPKAAVAAIGGALGAMQSGFQKLQGAFASTIPLSSPAAWKHYELAVRDVGGVIGQILLPAFQKLTAEIRHFGDFLISLPAPVKNAMSAFALFGVAVTSVGGALVLAAPLITAVTTGIGALVAVAGSLAGPLAVVGGILAGGVGIWAAYRTGLLDTLSAFKPLKNLTGTLTEIAQGMEGMFAGSLPIVAKLGALGIMGMEGLAKAMLPLVGLAQNLMKALLPIGSTLLSALAPIVGVMSRIGEGLSGKVLTVANKIVTAVGSMGAKLQEKIGPFVASIIPSIEKIGALLGEAFDAAMPALDAFIELAKEAFDIFLEYGLPVVSSAIAGIAKAIEFMLPAFKTAVLVIKGAFDFLRDTFKGFTNAIDDLVEKIKGLYAVAKSMDKFDLLPDVDFEKFKGGANLPPGADDKKFDKLTSEFGDTIDQMKKLWDKPTGSSMGAAVRATKFSGIEEFGRQAQLAAYGAAVTKPEDKLIADAQAREERQRRDAKENADRIVAAFNQANMNASGRAMRGF